MDLKGRHFLKLLDFTPAEIDSLLRFAARAETGPARRERTPAAHGKSIALIFEKASTRTRCAFEVAAYDQGARVTYLDHPAPARQEGVHPRHRRVLAACTTASSTGFEQSRVEDSPGTRRAGLERAHQRVPPTQRWRRPDHAGARRQTPAAGGLRFPGDRPQQRGQLAPVVAAKLGMDCRIVARRSCSQPRPGPDRARIAAQTGARIAVGAEVPGVPAAISSTPMSGCPWASPMPCGRSASGC